MKKALILIATAVLSACAATGPVYNQGSLDRVTPGKTQIVLYRTSAFGGAASSPTVSVNGEDRCDLSMNSYAVLSAPPGEITLNMHVFGSDSPFRLKTSSGHRYFIKTYMNTAKTLAAGGALAGIFVYNAATNGEENKGTWVYEIKNGKEAEEDLTGAKQSISCK